MLVLFSSLQAISKTQKELKVNEWSRHTWYTSTETSKTQKELKAHPWDLVLGMLSFHPKTQKELKAMLRVSNT